MNRLFKNVFFITALLIASVSYQAQAFFPLSTGGTVAIIWGVAAGLDLGFTVPVALWEHNGADVVIYALAGISALDAGRQSLVFSPISEIDATKFGLSADELASYNDELPLINLVSDQMAKAVGAQSISKDQVRDLYIKTADEVGVSKTARSALSKVVAISLKK